MHPTKKLWLAVIVGAIIAVPLIAFASTTSDTGLLVTGKQAELGATPGDPSIMIGKAIEIALGAIGVIFLILMIYAGFTWMIARGDEAKVEKAKETIINCIIGVVIVVAAYAITSYIIDKVGSTTANTSPAGQVQEEPTPPVPELGAPPETTDPLAQCGGCPMCTYGCKGGNDMPCACADVP
jgi:hypothetical protein